MLGSYYQLAVLVLPWLRFQNGPEPDVETFIPRTMYNRFVGSSVTVQENWFAGNGPEFVRRVNGPAAEEAR